MSAADIDRFKRDVAEHAITVIRDEGVYRHIKFAQGDSSCYRFDLVTFPGYLCYTGDMGTYVFERTTDMFTFFRKKDWTSIDFRYWAEKCEASDRDGIRKFSHDAFVKWVREWVDERESGERPDADEPDELAIHAAAYAELRAAVEDDVCSADSNDVRCYDAMNDFRHEGEAWSALHGKDAQFEFHDAWDGFDSATHEFTLRFKWCCYAMAWGIQQYDAHMAVAEVPA